MCLRKRAVQPGSGLGNFVFLVQVSFFLCNFQRPSPYVYNKNFQSLPNKINYLKNHFQSFRQSRPISARFTTACLAAGQARRVNGVGGGRKEKKEGRTRRKDEQEGLEGRKRRKEKEVAGGFFPVCLSLVASVCVLCVLFFLVCFALPALLLLAVN